jgi:hypothetical protein
MGKKPHWSAEEDAAMRGLAVGGVLDLMAAMPSFPSRSSMVDFPCVARGGGFNYAQIARMVSIPYSHARTMCLQGAA